MVFSVAISSVAERANVGVSATQRRAGALRADVWTGARPARRLARPHHQRLVLAGQHGVYCTSQRNPAVPAMDLRIIHQELVHAKELVQSVMEELRKAKEPRGT